MSWVLIALVFFLIGGTCGYALKTYITVRYEQKESILTTEPLDNESGYIKGVNKWQQKKISKTKSKSF